MSDESFARAMSLAVHELRTPVTVVAGYVRMVLKEQAGPVNDKQRKMLEEAEKSCGRISELVAELSEIGKLESGEMSLPRQQFDLAALLTEVASGMHEGHDRGVTLELHGADTPVIVAGDRTRISAIVKALMHASLRERGEPSTVTAALSTVDSTPTPWAMFAVGDAAALGALVDAGRETPPPFDEWRGGLGMALPVGRRVIEALGGAIWSAPGDRPRSGSAMRLPLGAPSR